MQRYAATDTKKRLWDREYASGKWACLENPSGGALSGFVEKYAGQGTILDLGCGPGTTAVELAGNGYASYTGVDISEVAIQKARERSADKRNEYRVSDIFDYVPERTCDVIVFGDSIYYVAEWRIASMLDRYSGYLNPSGVFIAWIRGPKPAIHATIEKRFHVVEKHWYGDSQVSVLVFRPRLASPEAAFLRRVAFGLLTFPSYAEILALV